MFQALVTPIELLLRRTLVLSIRSSAIHLSPETFCLKSGKAVFVIRRRQVARQPGAVTTQIFFFALLWLRGHCTALRVLTQAVMLLAAPPHSSRQPTVSIAALCSAASHFAPFHLVRSSTFCFMALSRHQPTTADHKRTIYHFANPTLQYSLGSIPLRSYALSLQPCSVHRLPVLLMLAGAPHCGCA